MFNTRLLRNRNNRRLAFVSALALCFFLYYYCAQPAQWPAFPTPGSHSHSHLHRPKPAIPYRKSSVDWSKFKHHHEITGDYNPLPKGHPHYIPEVQYPFSERAKTKHHAYRRNHIRQAFVKSWNSYKKHAWLADELAPISLTPKDPYGALAATLIDALDTLWIMGLDNDFAAAVAAVAQLDFDSTPATSLNLFETTIRHLGGLLSAYDLSGEEVLLRKATELGHMLYAAFDTPNRLPGFWLNFEDAHAGKQVAGTADPSASPSSLTMEFTRLAQLTGENKFYDAVARVTAFLERTQDSTRLPGIWPKLLNFRDERADELGDFTLGALADSLYEYLPKMHALMAGQTPSYANMYRKAADVIIKHMLFRPMIPDNETVLFSGDVYVGYQGGNPTLKAESQHLTCFTGGMFALAGKMLEIEEHVDIGEELARGCFWGYNASAHGLLPEIFGLVPCKDKEDCPWEEERWKKEREQYDVAKGFKHTRDARYILRPEAIESVFIMYRITGDTDWQEMAWKMFESITKATETEAAFAALKDVTVAGDPVKEDSMEVSAT